jgi:hypothetical protein
MLDELTEYERQLGQPKADYADLFTPWLKLVLTSEYFDVPKNRVELHEWFRKPDVTERWRAINDQIHSLRLAIQQALEEPRATSREKPSVAPPIIEEADALTRTLNMLPRSYQGEPLVKFLAEQPQRMATLEEACKHVYESTDKKDLVNCRLLIKRNEISLHERGAPLRIAWDRATHIVSLIDRGSDLYDIVS